MLKISYWLYSSDSIWCGFPQKLLLIMIWWETGLWQLPTFPILGSGVRFIRYYLVPEQQPYRIAGGLFFYSTVCTWARCIPEVGFTLYLPNQRKGQRAAESRRTQWARLVDHLATFALFNDGHWSVLNLSQSDLSWWTLNLTILWYCLDTRTDPSLANGHFLGFQG